MRDVELSVLVVTCDHAPFVAAAIESVLAQETSFGFEVIVSEDRSTDGTREIVERLAAANPGRIRLLLSDRNLNDNSVVRRGIEAARGRYLALLDGDDLWTSPTKLQRQLDLLEASPECTSCFHNVEVVHEDGATPTHAFHRDEQLGAFTQPRPDARTGLAELVRFNRVPTCSVVMRTECVRALPPWYDGLAAGDWPLHILCAERGELAYIDETMGVWRIHEGGVWTAGQSRLADLGDVEALVDVYDTFDRHLGHRFHDEIADEVSGLYQAAGTAALRRRDYELAGACARRSLRRSPARDLSRRWKALVVLASSAVGRLLPGRR